MTQWIEDSTGGRDRGPVALVRAWFEVLTRPRRFFERGVAPGDQAPGLVFASVVVLVEEASRFAVVDLASRGVLSTGPFPYPLIGDLGPLESLLALLAVVVFVAPAMLHLTAALQTLLLAPFAPDRGGVSQTVQVIAYATAPCVLAGLPFPELRVACALWGSALYVVGTSVIHDLSLPKATLLGAVPALLVFGYAFRGVAAAVQVLL
jgi:hypothetical protein